jgi:hypothetical protein
MASYRDSFTFLVEVEQVSEALVFNSTLLLNTQEGFNAFIHRESFES